MSLNRKQLYFATLLLLLGAVVLAYQIFATKSGEQAMGTSHKNRLANEKSPYLLQHADNPVDWYPWGEEAFQKARQEDKPIFLSIGYSTCHWCHVMEHESFEDPEVARLLNETFVCIKVDREERPDIDEVYMTVCQMLTGSGGWPLTIIMTPDKKPFYAATYIPKHSRFGRPGLMELIPRIRDLWQNDREKLLASAEEITRHLQQAFQTDQSGQIHERIFLSAYENLSQSYDPRFGGFGQRPKFPTPHNLLFLLRYWYRTGEEQAREMVRHTLHQMRLGGIYDHVGFGFHRYSTDAQWLVPHFEKMLYDQAMLSLAYLEAYQTTGEETFRRTAQEIFTYVLRDMTDPQGGFYSAEDADSEGEEGKFYLWTAAELREILNQEDARRVIQMFQVSEEGNFLEEASRRKTGRNILHLDRPLEEWAAEWQMSPEEAHRWWEEVRQRLFEAREKRIHPLKDDKILTDWNGLMIAALARGARVLQSPEYLNAARKAADFLLQTMVTPQGRLLHRFREGEAGIQGYLEDYAFFTWGLLELYQADFQPQYLQHALQLCDQAIAHFWDDSAGGFFHTPDDGEALLVRKKEVYDGAIPSGNSVMLQNLLWLSRMTGRMEYEERAQQMSTTFASMVNSTPHGYTFFLSALDFARNGSYEIVVVGRREATDTRQMLQALQTRYLPNKVLLFKPLAEPEADLLSKLSSFVEPMSAIDDRATVYVCQNFHCELPTTRIDEMLRLLGTQQGAASE